MKKLILVLAVFMSLSALAGKFTVFVKLPSGTIKTFSLMNIPSPDDRDMFHFRVDKTTLVVHASNVWVMSD